MKVLTYLGFTVLSIFIQFCVMDFIQEKIQLYDNDSELYSITKGKKISNDLLKNITDKPHALYYRTLLSKSLKNTHPVTPEKIYSNLTLPVTPLGITEISTTIIEFMYDENMSTTEMTPTTENFFTGTEFDNVTEITFFEIKNESSETPKKYFTNHCDCNLLFKVCDINCCCDQDCTDNDQRQFQCKNRTNYSQYDDGCISNLLHREQRYASGSLDSLFCVVKTNLPDRKSIRKPSVASAEHYNKWPNILEQQKLYEFKKAVYKKDDPIWLLRNGTIYYLDVPTTMVNNYCTDRTPMRYMREEKIQCIVKFNDLEMFHIGKTEESMIASATERTFNSSTLNCSNLHCINWTILACEEGICKIYNKSVNDVACSESNCLNVALKIDYIFYCYDSKIVNATIKMHIQKILNNVSPFVTQEVTVEFIMANTSLEHIIKFSGSPGYINHLPIIISYASSNFSQTYFNNTNTQNYLILPENRHGMCVLSNVSHQLVRFGLNRRTKCRYVHKHEVLSHNYTSACEDIQDNINTFLRIDKEVSIAPYGNPYGINDKDWIKLQIGSLKKEPVSGKFSEHASKLHCYNLADRVSATIMFASVTEGDLANQNKILSLKYETVPRNASFYLEDISIVLTIDITFIDVTKPNFYVYASSPHLNIHLPKDFFFPFPPNNRSHVSNSYIVVIFCCIFLSNKISYAQ